MSGILKFLSYKYGIDEHTISFETLMQIALYEGISIRWIDVESEESGLLCWGKGSSRMQRPIIYLRGRMVENSHDSPTAWFTLAHELGHYFLHPYLKYIDLRNIDKLPIALKDLSGISQLEADQFASAIFISTKELSELFEDQLIEALLNKKSDNAVRMITDDIYNYCCKKTIALPGVGRITVNAKRNLIIRTQRFVDRVREKVMLYYQDFSPTVNLEEMSVEDKKSLFASIKRVLGSYEEKM